MSSGRLIRVAIVDDHDLFADSLARMLSAEPDIEVVARAGSSSEAINAVKHARPDVAIVDYRLPDADGAATAAGIRASCHHTKVLMLTGGIEDARMVTTAVDAGCSGFLTKDKAASELVSAVRRIHAGSAHP